MARFGRMARFGSLPRIAAWAISALVLELPRDTSPVWMRSRRRQPLLLAVGCCEVITALHREAPHIFGQLCTKHTSKAASTVPCVHSTGSQNTEFASAPETLIDGRCMIFVKSACSGMVGVWWAPHERRCLGGDVFSQWCRAFAMPMAMTRTPLSTAM